MGYSRLPRFKRIASVSPIQLTDRDRAILRHVSRHHFLRSSHITRLMDGSKQQILRRLQLLYHHGYLERPRVQLEYYREGGSRHLVYGLGNKVAGVLKKGSRSRDSRWGEKNRSIRRLFFEHALLVSDIMVSFELACRKAPGIRFVSTDELKLLGSAGPQIKWRVRLNGHVRLGIIPDRVFVIDTLNGDGHVNRFEHFLDASALGVRLKVGEMASGFSGFVVPASAGFRSWLLPKGDRLKAELRTKHRIRQSRLPENTNSTSA